MDWSRRVVVRWLLVSLWAVSLLALAYPARVQAQGGGNNIHVVAAGETLRAIAQQYGVDMGTLLALNDLPNPQLIYVGQEIVVPGSGNGWEPPRRQDEQPAPWQQGGDRSGSNQQGQPNGQPYQYSGVGWEPQASQEGPNRQGGEGQFPQYNPYSGEVTWQDQPSQQDFARQGVGWDPQGPRFNPYSGERIDEGQFLQQDGSSVAWSPQPDQAGQTQDQSEDDWGWVNADNGANRAGNSWEPLPPPDRTDRNGKNQPAGEKWIDIDLGDQVLTAYQGDSAVAYFTISSGSSRYPTVTGTFYTYARYDLQDMSGGSKTDGTYYYQPDVPWVQYFHEGFAIHGAYWHNMFGTPYGHGCINMRVGESKWLYDWSGATGVRVEVHY